MICHIYSKFRRNELYFGDLARSWFQKNPINTLIHCGAFHAEEYEVYERNEVDFRIWIEAIPSLVSRLLEKFKHSSKDNVLEAALWKEDKVQLHFFLASNMASSSLLAPKDHLRVVPNVTFKESLSVSSVTLDTLLLLNSFGSMEVDLLVLDIQGAELAALQGSQGTLTRTQFVLVEVSKEELYENSTNWEVLNDYLTAQGFLLADWSYSNQHSWGDALYARKENFNQFTIHYRRMQRICITMFRNLVISISRRKWFGSLSRCRHE